MGLSASRKYTDWHHKRSAGNTQVVVDYSLADQVHATAKLRDVTTVKLWLGADVMLEYELEEAKQVLVSPVTHTARVGSLHAP